MRRAKLRVCASCEWVFKQGIECPKCLFGSYSAHYVYGTKAYTYSKTQKPWFDKKMFECESKFLQEIQESSCNITPE